MSAVPSVVAGGVRAAAPRRRVSSVGVLPGFGLSMGYTLLYLSLIVLVPLSALLFKSATLTLDQFYAVVTAPRVLASYKLTFGASLFVTTSGASRWSMPWSICRSPCPLLWPGSR